MVPDSVAVSQSSTRHWSLFRDLIRYSHWGFSAIGLSRSKVDEFGVAEAADLLHEMRMGVSSLSWAGGFTGSDGRSFQDAIDDGQQAIADAAALGAQTLILYPGGRNGHTCSHLRRLLRLALDELVPCAADHDVRLALEPVLGPEAERLDFTGRLDCAADLLSGWPASQVGLVADLFHLGRDSAAVKLLPQVIDRIALVQLADWRADRLGRPVRCLPGAGNLSVFAWLNFLRCQRYAGPIEIELHGSEFEFLGHDDLLMACREYLQACAMPVPFHPVPAEKVAAVAPQLVAETLVPRRRRS
jgi:sugar phosphate isomerase/epimerase